MIDVGGIRRRWEAIGSKLDERAQRMFAAAEVRTAGRGGLKVVARITGLARSTINRGEEISMANRCPQARSDARAAVASRWRSRTQVWCRLSNAWWSL